MSGYNDDNIVELDYLILHHETDAAYCVSVDEDEFDKQAPRIYLAKSLVRKIENPSSTSSIFLIPEWLAIDKDLV